MILKRWPDRSEILSRNFPERDKEVGEIFKIHLVNLILKKTEACGRPKGPSQLRAILRLKLLAHLHPAMVYAIALGRMPNEEDLRTIVRHIRCRSGASGSNAGRCGGRGVASGARQRPPVSIDAISH